jgi:HlyD family secretion protein
MRIYSPLIVGVAAAFAVASGLWGDRALGVLGVVPDQPHYLGYVEAETTLVAPPIAGRLVERPIERGNRVTKGERLFTIDPTQAEADVARTEAALAEAEARHQNMLTGKRAEEQDVIRARRSEVEAALAQAILELKRQAELLDRRIGTRQAYEQADSQVGQLRARSASLVAQERAGNLAARESEIAAGAAMVEQARANVAQAKRRLDDLSPLAPEDALVENTYFNVSEWVPAGSSVISLLPDFRVKLRFFVTEKDVAQARPGKQVRYSCDSCKSGLTATIVYVAPRAEYTPPVIYSHSARSKLVFLVEARPDKMPMELQPGLPISVGSIAEAKP